MLVRLLPNIWRYQAVNCFGGSLILLHWANFSSSCPMELHCTRFDWAWVTLPQAGRLRKQLTETGFLSVMWSSHVQRVVFKPWGFPRPFQEVWEVKPIFIITLRCYFPFQCVDTCTDGTEAMVGNTAGAVAYVKAAVPNYASCHCVSHCHSCAKNKPVSLSMSLVKQSDY